MRHVDKVRTYFSRPDKPAFSVHELYALGIPPSYAKVLVHTLLSRGEVVRLRKGWYSFHRDPLVFIFTLPPHTAYYGLGFAAYIHGAWDQVPNPEVLTYAAPRKVRAGVYTVLDTPLVVRRISKKLFGSYTLVRYGDWSLPVSTPEKTLTDLFYFDYPFLDEILPHLLGKIRPEAVKTILVEYPYPRSVKREVLKALKAHSASSGA